MVQLVPNISKAKLPKELYYPIKYADVAACFVSPGDENLYLDIYFGGTQSYWLKDRERLVSEGIYRLVRLDASGLFAFSWWARHKPWRDVENPQVIRINVYAIPRAIGSATKLDHAGLRNLLIAQVRQLTPSGVTSCRWELEITLLARSGLIECASKLWTEMRPEPEVRVQIPLAALVED